MIAMRIACIQMEVKDRSKAENLNHAEALIKRAEGADLILLPEIDNILLWRIFQGSEGFMHLHEVVHQLVKIRKRPVYRFGGWHIDPCVQQLIQRKFTAAEF